MNFVTMVEDQYIEDKRLIDEVIQTIDKSHVSYILRADDCYNRTLKFLDTPEWEKTRGAVMKHRFYYEIKVRKVINHE